MMEFFSPAKINIFFRVLKKRSDGYHEIASLFQAIDLFDILHISQDVTNSFTCSDSELPSDDSNLVVKALRLFQTRFPFPGGVKIHLEKRIPSQAGLGGGSGNAATTLWALNELFGRPASISHLVEMGAQLGSDVPFFFSLGTAYCTGRGEILQPVTLPSPLSGWIAKPPFGLSTPRVYQETRVEELLERDPKESIERFPLFYNDLEPAAFRLEPRLERFRDELIASGFKSVTMTGSGSAFVCLGGKSSFEGLLPFHSLQREEDAWYRNGKSVPT